MNEKKFYVEMFSKKAQVTVEEWEFNSLEDARKEFNYQVSELQRIGDDIIFILSTFDSDGDYIDLEEFDIQVA